MDNDDVFSPIVGRRHILRTAGALSLLGLVAPAAFAMRSSSSATDDFPDVSDVIDDPRFQAVCTLTPSQTAGPFYQNLNLLRTDITEGLPGIATRIFLTVVRASDCTPIPNAIVDVWHADASGRYSGFASQGTAGQTFLRGVQMTDANGLAHFDTIYPGWYPGRTTHIHLKVRPTATSELTTQLYFKQRLSNRVYTTPAYAAHGPTSTTNMQDGLFLSQTVMNVLPPMPGQLQLDLTIAVT